MDDFEPGDTDLGLEMSFTEQDSQEITTEEEVAPAGPDGKVLGKVAIQNVAGLRFPNKQPLDEEHQRCDYAVDLVGKVFSFGSLIIFFLSFRGNESLSLLRFMLSMRDAMTMTLT